MTTSGEKDLRSSPDHLLTLVQRDQDRKGRGHLKIFLGMAAGVGKTFTMLQRAHQLKAQGVDVVIGWVDTHHRKDTEALVVGIEQIPRKSVPHRGVNIEEMDLDAVLARKPKVVIVDELAHTNAPGLRHQKRYLDVLEILKNGIDVFTAVNIQHLESRVDTVREITGISVQETVPDSILDEADEVALIDLPPEDLLLRLKEGRVYPPERAETASRHFFTRGNLTALRELALRTATDRVDRDLRDFKTLHGIDEAWKSSSRLMVAVFASPYSNSLIRWTRQLADSMKGTWVGLYVDTGRPLNEVEKVLLEKNTELVRSLGGEFLAIQDQSLVDGILRVARQQNVTQIVVGKTQRGFWRNLLSGGSIVQRLLRGSGDIDVYAVSPGKEKALEHKDLAHPSLFTAYPWGEAGWVAAGVLGGWLSAAALNPVIGYESVGILFLIAVTLSGLFLSRGSVFTMAIAFSVIHNFFFIPPLYTLSIERPQDILMCLMYFIAASSVGHLTTRLRRQNQLIQTREDKAVQLFRLAHGIAEARDLDEVIQLGVETLNQTFQAETTVILFSDFDGPVVHPRSSFVPDEKEQAVARWVKDNGLVAGRFTDTLPSAAAIYFPISIKQKVAGVLGMVLPRDFTLKYEGRNLAHALVGQIAAGFEREVLHEATRRLDTLEQADRMYRSLFDSVSHELKTPLTTIRGAVSAARASEGGRISSELLGQLQQESDRLLDVVDNMLDMTRIESGTLRVNLQVVDVADILAPALKKLGSAAKQVSNRVEAGIPPILCDAALAVQALVNVLRNAVVYAGASAQVTIEVKAPEPGRVQFRIQDNGPGLPPGDPNRVFDRFYRGNPGQAGGVGLGLSIARGFLECQGGTITAANVPGGGACFTLSLKTSTQ